MDDVTICAQCGSEMNADDDVFGHADGPLCSEACFFRITADDDPAEPQS